MEIKGTGEEESIITGRGRDRRYQERLEKHCNPVMFRHKWFYGLNNIYKLRCKMRNKMLKKKTNKRTFSSFQSTIIHASSAKKHRVQLRTKR